jgi:hypothetical protein
MAGPDRDEVARAGHCPFSDQATRAISLRTGLPPRPFEHMAEQAFAPFGRAATAPSAVLASPRRSRDKGARCRSSVDPPSARRIGRAANGRADQVEPAADTRTGQADRTVLAARRGPARCDLVDATRGSGAAIPVVRCCGWARPPSRSGRDWPRRRSRCRCAVRTRRVAAHPGRDTALQSPAHGKVWGRAVDASLPPEVRPRPRPFVRCRPQPARRPTASRDPDGGAAPRDRP